MGIIGRPLSGELEGLVNPREYGFGVVPVETTEDEDWLGAAALYRGARARTGVIIKELEGHLTKQPYDIRPAERLLKLHAAASYPYECEFGSARLTIDEGVFCPVFTNVSPFLLEHVDFRPGERVLDTFTGSGAFAVQAALQGGEVVAFDTSQHAVVCARNNADSNGVGDKVEVQQGTLWETISPDMEFDLMLANPPLIPISPGTLLEGALFDKDLEATKQYIRAIPTLLAKNGRAYVTSSDVIDRDGYRVDLKQLCQENGLTMETVAQKHLPYESYRVHKIRHRTAAACARSIVRTAFDFIKR